MQTRHQPPPNLRRVRMNSQALLRGALGQQSAVILICMAIDRYMCMLHPVSYHKHSSKKVSFAIMNGSTHLVLLCTESERPDTRYLIACVRSGDYATGRAPLLGGLRTPEIGRRSAAHHAKQCVRVLQKRL
jgi:hypothetical protein